MRISATLFALLVSASPAAASPADAGLGRLSIYDGTWSLKTTYYKTAYSRPHVESVVLQTQCKLTPGYYVCNQLDKGESARLIIYTYDAKKDEYYAYFITQNAAHATSGMRLVARASTWTYSARLSDPNGSKIYDRVVNTISGNDAISFEEDISKDGLHWTVMDKGREARVS
jgi:hypothetical protein